MRSCEGLVDSLLYVIHTCVNTSDYDSKVCSVVKLSIVKNQEKYLILAIMFACYFIQSSCAFIIEMCEFIIIRVVHMGTKIGGVPDLSSFFSPFSFLKDLSLNCLSFT